MRTNVPRKVSVVLDFICISNTSPALVPSRSLCRTARPGILLVGARASEPEQNITLTPGSALTITEAVKPTPLQANGFREIFTLPSHSRSWRGEPPALTRTNGSAADCLDELARYCCCFKVLFFSACSFANIASHSRP